MFKKKGGPAFKPKIPSARSRQAAPASTAATKAAESQKVADALAEAPSQDDSEVRQQEKTSQDAQQAELPPQNESLPPHRRRRSSAGSSVKGVDDAAARKPSSGTAKKGIETIAEEATVKESTTATKDVPARATRASTEVSQSEPTQPAQSQRQTRRERRASQLSTTSSTGRRPSIVETTTTESQQPQSSVETQAAEPEEPAPKVQPATRSRRRASVATTEKDGETSTTPAPARPRKRSKAAAADGEEPASDSQPRKRSTASTSERRPSAPRRARSLTPEDSETKMVDLQKLKMSDLTRDLHIGKKFSRHDELRERERLSRLRAKLDRESSVAGDTDTRSSTPLEDRSNRIKSGTPGSAPSSAAAGAAGAPAGPQFRIVDGQIVVDQSSLVMDRHARAAAAQEDMETVEENDFTRLITSSSFMNTSKLRGPNIWTEPETELFYHGLSMFGTEFQMISHMFPGKQRRHIKLKFNREERYNPARIDAALTGEKTTKMDIDEYKALTGAEFESVADIEAEHNEIRAGYEAERQRVADEQAEIMRKKREELFADEDGDAAKKKKGKRKGKQSVSYGLNGEPIYGEA